MENAKFYLHSYNIQKQDMICYKLVEKIFHTQIKVDLQYITLLNITNRVKYVYFFVILDDWDRSYTDDHYSRP